MDSITGTGKGKDHPQAEKIQKYARRLGGGWRIEHDVMPVVVLTIVEAERLVAELDEEKEQKDQLITYMVSDTLIRNGIQVFVQAKDMFAAKTLAHPVLDGSIEFYGAQVLTRPGQEVRVALADGYVYAAVKTKPNSMKGEAQ